MASCAIHRLMKFSEFVSKNLLKKGSRERDLAIQMPSKGILSCYYLESTLNICSNSPLTSRLYSSITILLLLMIKKKIIFHPFVTKKKERNSCKIVHQITCHLLGFIIDCNIIVDNANQDVLKTGLYWHNDSLSSFVLGVG